MDADQDPELARMLSQVAQLSESDRLVAKRVLELLAAQNAKKLSGSDPAGSPTADPAEVYPSGGDHRTPSYVRPVNQ